MDELRKRALDYVAPLKFVAKDASLLETITQSLATFAASEADRRERECIEAMCVECRLGSPVCRYWEDSGHEWYHAEEDRFCDADRIHELRYKREQREKEKAGPLSAGTPS